MIFTPQNIESFATFLRSDVDIQDRVIHFGPGLSNEQLIEVPINFGEINQLSTIAITLGVNKTHFNTLSIFTTAVVGISDRTNKNLFFMTSANNYEDVGPCSSSFPSDEDLARASVGTQAPATFKLTFTPFSRFAFCETAQENGFINTATFGPQLDITKPLFLTVQRNNAADEQYFHYFMVEIY